jgi:hypothetical protein
VSDSVVVLNPGVGGQNMDAEDLPGAGPSGQDIYRERIQVTGKTLSEIAIVNNLLPLLADMGLTVRVAGNRSETATTTSVAQNIAAVTLLAANAASRIGCSVFNDSNANLYLKTGAAASLASFTVELVPGAYWEAPYGYSGIITGIWDAAGAGAALVEEYT